MRTITSVTPQELVTAWVDDLRSGTYQQTREVLKRTNQTTGQSGYCCLGVLCETALRLCPELAEFRPIWDGPDTHFDGHTGTLPNWLASYIRLDEDGHIIARDWYEEEHDEWNWEITPFVYEGEEGTTRTSLIQFNDEFQLPFSAIATLVEEQLLPRLNGENT